MAGKPDRPNMPGTSGNYNRVQYKEAVPMVCTIRYVPKGL